MTAAQPWCWSELNHLRRENVFACPNFGQQFFARCGIEIQHSERCATGLISTERHCRNVHAMTAEQCANSSNHPGPVCVFQYQHDTMWTRFYRTIVNAYDSWSDTEKRTTDRHDFSFAGSG